MDINGYHDDDIMWQKIRRHIAQLILSPPEQITKLEYC